MPLAHGTWACQESWESIKAAVMSPPVSQWILRSFFLTKMTYILFSTNSRYQELSLFWRSSNSRTLPPELLVPSMKESPGGIWQKTILTPWSLIPLNTLNLEGGRRIIQTKQCVNLFNFFLHPLPTVKSGVGRICQAELGSHPSSATLDV